MALLAEEEVPSGVNSPSPTISPKTTLRTEDEIDRVDLIWEMEFGTHCSVLNKHEIRLRLTIDF